MVETRRWPWLAALLSLLLFAGLGQAYAGRWRRALLFFIGELVCQALGLGILLHLGVATVNVALGFGLVLAYRACAAVDAARVTEGSHGVRAYVRWPIYLALVVGFLLTPRLARAHVAEAFRMPTRSMEGTIVPGDRILTEKLAIHPTRHDVVVYETIVNGEPQTWVKRVVGLPGERVELRGGALYVDGKPVEESYAQGESKDFGPVEVPADSYFVLGDHRDASRDSRHDGPVARDRIFGRAKMVFWSSDPREGTVRWDRVGKLIR